MKKSLLITTDFPPKIGGVANYYANLCQNLSPKNIIVLASQYKDSVHFDEKQSYNIYRRKLMFKSLVWPKWLPLFWHILALKGREKLEILQVGEILPIGTVALVFKKILGIPYVVYAHGMDITISQSHPRKKKLIKKILKNAYQIISSNQFTKNKIVELGIEESKVVVVYPCPNNIPNFLPVSACAGGRAGKSQTQNSNFQIPDLNIQDKKILLTVGRLVERKGHDMVIKALSKVLEKVPGVIYLIVGEGGYQKKLEELVKKNQLKNKVIFKGKVSNQELASYYQTSDIFIMPSRQIGGDYEGFGIVYLEANLYGKPVIAGRSGGVEEAVVHNKTGLLVDPDSPDEISEAIIKLFTDKNLANKFGVQGKERVLKKFKWENQAKKIEKILG